MTEPISRRELLRDAGGLAGAAALLGGAGLGWAQDDTAGVTMPGPQAYELPPLPYAYDALAPAIDEQTMRLHHDTHHAGYVRGLNAALRKLAEARSAGEAGMIRYYADDAAFHGSGHALHTIFWRGMKANGGGEPGGMVGRMIRRDFGSVDGFKTHFKAAAGSVQGSGWGVLSYDPLGQRLLCVGVKDHQHNDMIATTPLLVVDVWEHAYYLNYQNRRGEYVDAFVERLINWQEVNRNLRAAIG